VSLQVTLLGTGIPLPSADRAGPATMVRAGQAVLLADCGRGGGHAAGRGRRLPLGLSAVLLTHLHSDHVSDLTSATRRMSR
jgi:ribonuclease Z